MVKFPDLNLVASIHGNIDAAAEERDPENFNPTSNLRGEDFFFPFSFQDQSKWGRL